MAGAPTGALRAVAAAALLVALVAPAACRTSRRASSGSGAPSCRVRRFRPASVPRGFAPATLKPVLPAQWSEAWSSEGAWFEVEGGTSANFGEDSSAHEAKVRGFQATVGRLTAGSRVVAVTWLEPPPAQACSFQYAVLGSGVDEATLLGVANSLRPSPPGPSGS